jgi:ribonuclease HI
MKLYTFSLKPAFVQLCQKELNDISAQHAVGLYWVPGNAGLRENEIADKLARDSSV